MAAVWSFVVSWMRRHMFRAHFPYMNRLGGFLLLQLSVLFQCLTAFESCNRTAPLDLFILQDGTQSFATFLTFAKSLYPGVVGRLRHEHKGPVRVGISLFGDKPRRLISSDVCWRDVVEMTDDFQRLLAGAGRLSRLCHGGDAPDNILEAMAYAAATGAGFSSDNNTIKVLMTVTDTTSHVGPGRRGVDLTRGIPCGHRDPYSAYNDVRTILSDSDVVLLMMIHPDTTTWWNQTLQGHLGLPESRLHLQSFETSDPDDFVELTLAAIKDASCKAMNSERVESLTLLPLPSKKIRSAIAAAFGVTAGVVLLAFGGALIPRQTPPLECYMEDYSDSIDDVGSSSIR